MASIDNHILTITEPTIKLDEVKFESLGEGDGSTKAITSKGYLLMVSINGYVFSDMDILNMNLDCNGSMPIIDITILDSKGQFGIDNFPRDGDVINFRMGTLDKTSYKDIRIDFDIIEAEQPKQNSNSGATGRYNFVGRIKVPGLYTDECKSYGVGTSLEHIESIANDLKLGLATNIDTSDDKMHLILPYNNKFDTLNALVMHSYIDEDSFQVHSIDPFYYINYVNLNTLLESKETFEEIIVAFDKELNDVPHLQGDDSINQIKKPLVITNHARDVGTNLYIEAHSLINNAGSKSKKNGYKRTLQFFENDSEEGFVSHDVQPLVSKTMSDIEEPMKGRRDEDRYKNEVKTKYVGRKNADPETSNAHLNYEYSVISNMQNIDEVKKMSLEVALAAFNPAIHLYQKIPVLIYINEQLKLIADKDIKNSKKEKGFETASASSEEVINPGEHVADDFLSGYYIVGGLTYMYKSGWDTVKQKIKLLRREWPSRINNLTEETVKPQPTPVPPVAPAPVPEPAPPPEPVKIEYNVSSSHLDTQYINWKSNLLVGNWTVTPEGSPVPTINIELTDTKTQTIVTLPTEVTPGGVWKLTIQKVQIIAAQYRVVVKLNASGGEKAESETVNIKFTKWNPNSDFSGIQRVRVGNLVFLHEVRTGTEPGTYVGTYTKASEAGKDTSPMSGRIEGTDGQKVLSETAASVRAEYAL